MGCHIIKTRRSPAIMLRAASAMSALALIGCAAPVPQRAAGPAVGNQGHAWEMLLPPPRVDDGAGSSILLAAGPEVARRDAALGVAPEAYVAAGTWSDAQPRLDDLRRLSLSSQPDSIQYYRSRRPR